MHYMRGQVTDALNVYGMQGRQLVIPVYQRNYDWGQPQCRQLLADLVDVALKGRPKHFFGAVVGQPEGSWRWIVIDGQQRLTTVSLLMLALADLIDDGAISSDDSQLSSRIRTTFLLLDETSGSPRFKLKPVKDDAAAYGALFREEAEYVDTSSVTANYRYFREQIPQLPIKPDQLWKAIEKLEVMHLDLEPHDEAQRIFESLNSTGLALSEADKVRNLVLMGLESDEQNRVYEHYWNQIEKNVNYATGTFLRWFLITRTTRRPRRDQVYEAFKAYANDRGLRGAQLLDEVLEYSRYFKQAQNADVGNSLIDARLSRLNLLQMDVLLPLLMPLLREFARGTISASDLADTLRIIESYLFRRNVTRYATNALNGVFESVYREVSRMRPEGRTFTDVFAYSMSRRTGSGTFPTDQEFAEALRTADMYHFRAERRQYLFECLENLDSNDSRDIAARIETGNLTVEHIMPQTLTDAWRKELGEDAAEIHETWLHRLGNLTVTGYNSTYSNAAFAEKKTMKFGFDDSPFRLNREMRNSNTWTLAQLQERSERLVADAMAYWKYPETDFEPPRPQLPAEPLGEDTNFTGRTAVGFTFGEHRATVRSWKDLALRVFKLVLVEHREAFFAFARTTDYFRVGAEFDPNERGVLKVDDGLGWSSNTDTLNKVTLMRRLFAHIDLDPNELIITLQPGFNHHVGAVDEVETDLDSELADQPYAELLKFRPLLDELIGSDVHSDQVRDVAEEFLIAFAPFSEPQPHVVLGTSPARFVADEEKMRVAGPEQFAALIGWKSIEAKLLDPDAIATAIVDGTLSDWVSRLRIAKAVPIG